MKRLLLFIFALTYVLPKVQPSWDGMIIRCDQPQPKGLIYSIEHIPTCIEDKCNCHWECEFGVETLPVIDNGNQTVIPVGCSKKIEEPRIWNMQNESS